MGDEFANLVSSRRHRLLHCDFGHIEFRDLPRDAILRVCSVQYNGVYRACKVVEVGKHGQDTEERRAAEFTSPMRYRPRRVQDGDQMAALDRIHAQNRIHALDAYVGKD